VRTAGTWSTGSGNTPSAASRTTTEDWVYLGNGHWEDADVITWTPEQRREYLGRYRQLVHDTIDAIKRTDPPPPTPGSGDAPRP
jgi:hypothetical protein